MKKTSLLFFSAIYLLFTCGVLLNIHYCGGTVSSVNLAFASAKCACGEEVEKNDCCKNEHKTLKISDSHKTSTTFLTKISNFASEIYTIFTISNDFPLFQSACLAYYKDFSPPLGVPLYTQYCTYRI